MQNEGSQMIIKLEVKEGLHIKPSIFDLESKGFKKVAVCEDCGIHVAEYSINPYAPCSNCGGNFSGLLSFVGKYIDGKWYKRVGIDKAHN